MMDVNLTLPIQIGNFFITYWILKRYFFGPLLARSNSQASSLRQLVFEIRQRKKRLEELAIAQKQLIHNFSLRAQQQHAKIVAAPSVARVPVPPSKELANKREITREIQQSAIQMIAQRMYDDWPA